MCSSMGQLVDHEVAHHLRALEQQAAVEADRAAGRAAAPARALAADQHPLEAETRARAHTRAACGASTCLRPLGQPAPQHLAHGAAVARIAARAPASRSPMRCHARTALADSGEMDAPDSRHRPARSILRRRKRSRGDRASPRLLALALDPGAMPLEEALDRARGSPRGHDDFHAAGVKHTHGQTPCALALANDPPCGGVLVGP